MPIADTQELPGMVGLCVAVRLSDERPMPFTVFWIFVPNPEPILVLAVTVVIRLAFEHGTTASNTVAHRKNIVGFILAREVRATLSLETRPKEPCYRAWRK